MLARALVGTGTHIPAVHVAIATLLKGPTGGAHFESTTILTFKFDNLRTVKTDVWYIYLFACVVPFMWALQDALLEEYVFQSPQHGYGQSGLFDCLSYRFMDMILRKLHFWFWIGCTMT